MKHLFSKKYLIHYLSVILIGGLLVGCKPDLKEKTEKLFGERLYNGYIRVGVTYKNSLEKSKLLKSPINPSCKIIISKIEVSDTGVNWFPVVENNTDIIDLFSPDSAFNKVHVYNSTLNELEPTSYQKVRITVHKFIINTENKKLTFEGSSGPSLTSPDATGEIEINMTITRDRETLLVLNLDPIKSFANIELGKVEIISARTYYTDLLFIPYLKPSSSITGMWSNGDLVGYYDAVKKILMDKNALPIGTFNFHESPETGNYTFSSGELSGLRGHFIIMNKGFTHGQERIFIMNNKNNGGIWLREGKEGFGYFMFDSFWPAVKSGSIFDRNYITIGEIKFNSKVTLYGACGTYKITKGTKFDFTGETGSVYIK